MRASSEYHFRCICGAKIISQKREGTCPDCGRSYEVCWDDPPMEKQRVDFTKPKE